jgi:hypothetical protein
MVEMKPDLRKYRRISRDENDSNFKAHHRPETQIRHADAISRHIQTVTTSHTLSRELVKEEQGKGNFCRQLEVENAKGKSEYFFDEEGIIYRRRKNGEHQLVVPKYLVKEVIALYHDPFFAAHPGRNRTLEFLFEVLLARHATGSRNVCSKLR